ncbi:hypothetical protein EJ08DRAFT_391505 [Tothia fuscella]|uniref:Uncharacterized protein n=1 Tax=Tothia fuscella TaxID=1048955 RepID=A0A9P4U2Q9_9PEZI|nr:hypothetical protein EJ08DRAFT_391505 [Tothia fuscella]
MEIMRNCRQGKGKKTSPWWIWRLDTGFLGTCSKLALPACSPMKRWVLPDIGLLRHKCNLIVISVWSYYFSPTSFSVCPWSTCLPCGS